MAKKNGDDIVYNCSDCGENYVRYYGFGGDGPGSACDTHLLTPAAIKFIHQHPDKNHIWYEVLADTDWKKVTRSFLTKFGDWFVNLPIW